jgi:hypothetical protein
MLGLTHVCCVTRGADLQLQKRGLQRMAAGAAGLQPLSSLWRMGLTVQAAFSCTQGGRASPDGCGQEGPTRAAPDVLLRQQRVDGRRL